MTVGDIRQEVARRAADGERLDQIETEVIEPASLLRDEKDALWLYALGCEPAARPLGRRAARTRYERGAAALAGAAHD